MIDKGMLEEQEIDLLDFLKAMLEQWRGWLAFGLVCALLLPLGKNVVDLYGYNASNASNEAAIAEGTEDASNASISFSDEFMSAAQSYVMLQGWREYYENSVLMSIDPNDVHKLVLMYYIEAESAEVDGTGLAAVYSELSHSSDFTEILSESMGIDMDSSDANELIGINTNTSLTLNVVTSLESLNTTGVTSNAPVFTLVITVPNGVAPAQVRKCIEDYYHAINSEVASRLGEHVITLFSSSERSGFDSGLLAEQGAVRQNIVKYSTDYTAMYGELTDEEKTLLDRAIKENRVEEYLDMAIAEREGKNVNETMESAGEQDLVEIEAEATPVISKKLAVLGFFFGIVLYCGMAFLYMIFVRRFRSGDEALSLLGVRSFGSVYEYPYKGVIQRFLHDKKVYEWRHKKEMDNISDISEAISAKAAYESIKELNCLILGFCSDGARATINKIIAGASGRDLDINVIDAPKGLDSIREEDIVSFKPVILSVLSGVTTPRQALEVMARLKEYNVPVVGIQFVEG